MRRSRFENANVIIGSEFILELRPIKVATRDPLRFSLSRPAPPIHLCAKLGRKVGRGSEVEPGQAAEITFVFKGSVTAIVLGIRHDRAHHKKQGGLPRLLA